MQQVATDFLALLTAVTPECGVACPEPGLKPLCASGQNHPEPFALHP